MLCFTVAVFVVISKNSGYVQYVQTDWWGGAEHRVEDK